MIFYHVSINIYSDNNMLFFLDKHNVVFLNSTKNDEKQLSEEFLAANYINASYIDVSFKSHFN
jgi:hypothetical protein